jgi:tRNA-splicing endonuclease subunit Sen15
MVVPTSTQQPPEPSAVSKLIDSSGVKTASEAVTLEILHNLRYQHDWSDLRLHVIHIHDHPQPGQISGLGLGSGAELSNNDDEQDQEITSSSTIMINLDSDSYLSQRHTSTSTPTSTPSHESSNASNVVQLISGLPPRHSYIHPDLQLHLVKHLIPETSLPVQREFVLPLSTADTWTLRRFCAVFDALSERETVVVNHADQVHSASPAVTAGGGGDAVVVNGNGNGNGGAATRVNGTANRAIPTPLHEHKDQKRVLLGMRAREGRGGDGTVVYYIMQEGEVKPRQNG